MFVTLFGVNTDFRGDLVRNIRGIRTAQALFDDLSPDPADWTLAIAAEGRARIPTATAPITRPFDYGTAITYGFEAAHWHSTRFSDGTRYGVWYGSLDVKTTVFETVYHWHRFLTDSYEGLDRVVVSERRVLDVRCDALLVDLREKAAEFPELVSRSRYAFTHSVGTYAHDQHLNGLLVPSARCDGVNAAILNADRLSDPRDKMFLTYRCDLSADRCVVERKPGRSWLVVRPGTLA